MTYKIISGQYELGTQEQQAEFKMLLQEDNIQYKFDLYFHWYNIIHELGHCLIDSQQIHMTPIQEEMFVNEFAVSYWNYIGQQDTLKELENLLININENIDSPVPNHMTLTEYYESIWETDNIEDVMVYGYFQLNSVLEALKSKKDFKTVLKSINIDLPTHISMTKYKNTINAKNAYTVLETAITNLHMLDIHPLHVVLELVDNPQIQCAETSD